MSTRLSRVIPPDLALFAIEALYIKFSCDRESLTVVYVEATVVAVAEEKKINAGCQANRTFRAAKI